MKRRHFLKGVSVAAAVPTILNGVPVSAMRNSPFIQLLAKSGDCDGHVLVMIQLNGGNDGLNTVIPLDQYSKLAAARSNILIPENKVLPLNGTDKTGFHPAMARMQQMYNEGQVTVIQNVGYPSQDFSHFRSTDIWLSGSSASETLSTGWMGRYLQTEHPDFPNGYPNAANPDPLAVQIGYVVSPAFMGEYRTMGMAITDPDNFYQLITDTESTIDDTPRGHELAFLRQTARQTNSYADRIKNSASAANNLSSLYPVGNKLADQLKIVARLIAGGLETKVYMVSLGGFDTHAAQTDLSDTTKGAHASLLQQVSEAVFAFQDDLKLLAVDDRVLGMTFSEFGRRIASNGSNGTDHGAAAPMFLFGKAFPGKIIGANPNLPANAAPNDNLIMGIDYRSMYASVLRDWFCVPDEVVDGVFGDDFDYLPLTTGVNEIKHDPELSVYPNPFKTSCEIKFVSLGEEVKVEVYNALGVRVAVIHKQHYTAGVGVVHFNGENLANGSYYIRIASKSYQSTVPVLKIAAV